MLGPAAGQSNQIIRVIPADQRSELTGISSESRLLVSLVRINKNRPISDSWYFGTYLGLIDHRQLLLFFTDGEDCDCLINFA